MVIWVLAISKNSEIEADKSGLGLFKSGYGDKAKNLHHPPWDDDKDGGGIQ
jgi:hypothetical protein